MKNITLKSLTLVNFKGIRSLSASLGQAAEIRGGNATGKSTIADAFTWALFGKDAAGNSDTKFGIKTCDAAGNVIPKIDHEVTALLDVDGQSVELRRVLSEDWVTPRGSAESALKGNTTSYFYNGVPMKESEYNAKVGDILGEDLFRMVTSPHHFSRLGWQSQREILLTLAGGVTLGEVAAGRAEFTELLDILRGKSLAEYKAEIAARKKKIREAMEAIPARIDEVTRATPAAPDFAALEAEKSALQKELADVERALASEAEAARQQGEAQAELQRRINDLKREHQEVRHGAEAAAREAAFAATAGRRELEYEVKCARADVARLKSDVAQQSQGKQEVEARLVARQREVEGLRKAWADESAQEYPGSDSCPHCRQPLPEDMRAEARSLFENAKAAKLDEITWNGRQAAAHVALVEKETVEASERLLDLGRQLEEREEALAQLEAQLAALPAAAEAKALSPADVPACVEIQGQIDALEAQLAANPAAPGSDDALAARRRSLTAQLDGVKSQLGLRAVIEANEARKEQLLSEERSLAQQKADLEKQEYVADTLVKEQMVEVERRVNSKFRQVRFRLFTSQINGGEKPDCVMYSATDGAKYLDMNSAQKVNAGLDVINALCELNGVTAPIFIDNAEGVNELIPTKSQIIRLVVTKDNSLIIN
jgi:DNA repair exonuclease SbcCD ATPase subunit